MTDDLVKRLRDADAYNSKHYIRDPLHSEAAKRIEALEDNLAKAVEALEKLVIEYDEVDLAHDEPKSMTAAYDLARTTLAELKGETDE